MAFKARRRAEVTQSRSEEREDHTDNAFHARKGGWTKRLLSRVVKTS